MKKSIFIVAALFVMAGTISASEGGFAMQPDSKNPDVNSLDVRSAPFVKQKMSEEEEAQPLDPPRDPRSQRGKDARRHRFDYSKYFPKEE